MPVSSQLRRRLEDFVTLCRWEHYFNDHGPQNPWLRSVADLLHLSNECRLWLCLLGMAYYHEGSAWAAWSTPGVPMRRVFPPTALPIGSLRRNLYGGRIRKHLLALQGIKSFTQWLAAVRTWPNLLQRLSQVWGNGRWASYTAAEALVLVADLPVRPTADGFLANSGPRLGLTSLGLPATTAGVQQLCSMLQERQLAIPIQVLETVMCNWNNLLRGQFYIGRSLDRQQTRIKQVEDLGVDCTIAWRARRAAFKAKALGEVNGWPGLDKPRLQHYKRTGELLLPWERR